MGMPTEQVLVTGATGFLGRRLCCRLKDDGRKVIGSGRSPAAGPWDSFRVADIARGELPGELLANVSTIYHLASKAHALAETPGESSGYDDVIVGGTRRLLAAAEAAGVQRFVYVSSVKAMGEGNPPEVPPQPIDESAPLCPQEPYGRAKAEAESLVASCKIPHWSIIRPVMVYGPGEKGNLPRMLDAVRKGRFPPLPDTGNHRSMVHVDDLLDCLELAATKPVASGNAYIVTGADAPSTRELYDAMRAALGLDPVLWSVPMWSLRVAAWMGCLLGRILNRRMPLDLQTLQKLTGSAWYTSRRATEDLGYQPRYGVMDWLSKEMGKNGS